MVAVGIVVRPRGDRGVVERLNQNFLIGIQRRRECCLPLDVTVSMLLERTLTLASFDANGSEQEK